VKGCWRLVAAERCKWLCTSLFASGAGNAAFLPLLQHKGGRRELVRKPLPPELKGSGEGVAAADSLKVPGLRA